MQSDLNWFVGIVAYNNERACQEKLERLLAHDDVEFSTYVPVQREMHEWPSTGKRVMVDRIICPSMLFIRCTDAVRYTIACKAHFIHHFMMDRARKTARGTNDFARIPHKQMADFMRVVGDASTPVSLDPKLLFPGSKVRVKSGRFEGIEGILDKAPDGSSTLAIRVDFLGYAKMDFPLELFELVK